MEATAEGFGLLRAAICPPKLEEAGLEDCALPPEAIKEAFLKAANYAKSRVIPDEDDDEGGCCVEDPGPSNGEVPDALVGTGEIPTKPRCGGVREKGGSFLDGGEQGLADAVVVVGAGEDVEGGIAADRVVVLGGEEEAAGSDDGGKKACVGEDVQNGDKAKEDGGEEVDGGGEEEKPILVEVLI